VLRSFAAIAVARRKLVGWVVLALAFAGYVLCFGVPFSSDTVLLWIAAALFVSCLDGMRWRRVVRDWLPLYVILAIYNLLRGYASHTLWGPFVGPQAWFDTHVFGGVAPTVQLQRWLFDPRHLHVWDYAAWLTYDTYFFAPFIVAAVLWKVDYPRFKRYVSLFVGLTAAGYLTYVLYPAMPPWMASQTGHLPATTRIVPVVWNHVGFHQAAALFTGGSRFDNNIAAMPSLHAAYAALICVFFWRSARPWARGLLAFYALAMAFSLVYGAEHFVIDVFMGWIYVAGTYAVGTKLLDRWQARQEARHASGQDPVERESVSREVPQAPTAAP
jgi:membrane-associated phospholipid phosphatase